MVYQYLPEAKKVAVNSTSHYKMNNLILLSVERFTILQNLKKVCNVLHGVRYPLLMLFTTGNASYTVYNP